MVTTDDRAQRPPSPSSPDSTWFRRYDNTEADGATAPRVFCFPHAGGAASAYLPLSRALAPRVDAVAVQYPARQDRHREPAATSLTDLAATIAERLAQSLGDDRPYALFGHSMGALLAHETAHHLGRLEAPAPAHLFLSGRGAPVEGPWPSDQIEGDEALLAEIRRLGGTGGGVLEAPELLEMVLPALRADYRALSTYRWIPGPLLDTPITVLVGTDDPVVPQEAAAGWLGYTTKPGKLHVFPGGHFYLDTHTAPVADLIATTLST